ncbi:MAG: hypothetical protein ACPLTR_06025 [Thermacetogeniaceae bacterium]
MAATPEQMISPPKLTAASGPQTISPPKLTAAHGTQWLSAPHYDTSQMTSGIVFGLGQPSRAVRERLLTSLPSVRFGSYVPTKYLPEGYVPIRLWARQHGVENLLRWDPKTQSVYLGWQKVPYGFITGGRSYADEARLNAILRRLRMAGVR